LHNGQTFVEAGDPVFFVEVWRLRQQCAHR
jgi:hypothetical protein